MNSRHRRMALILSVPGIAACTFAIAAFLLDFQHNRIPFGGLLSHREQYLALGRAFSRGFVSGFFLCFFLMLVAVAVGTWYEQRRRPESVSNAGR